MSLFEPRTFLSSQSTDEINFCFDATEVETDHCNSGEFQEMQPFRTSDSNAADFCRPYVCEEPILLQIFRDRQLPLEGGGTTGLNVFIPKEQGDVLYELIRRKRPRTTLEIGLANGISTAFMCLAHRDNERNGTHIAIDPFQSSYWKNAGVGLIRMMGLNEQLRFIEDYSHLALAELEREGIRVGLAFIDGAHLTDYAFADFLFCDRLLEVGGLLAFDDADWTSIRPVVRYALTNRGYKVIKTPVIEPPPGHTRLPARLARWFLRLLPNIEAIVRKDWLDTDEKIDTQGRLVVLQKTNEDDRDSQARESHFNF